MALVLDQEAMCRKRSLLWIIYLFDQMELVMSLATPKRLDGIRARMLYN